MKSLEERYGTNRSDSMLFVVHEDVNKNDRGGYTTVYVPPGKEGRQSDNLHIYNPLKSINEEIDI